MGGDLDRRPEEERLIAKGFKKPYYPWNAELRRWDGNEMLGNLGDRVLSLIRPVLRLRPIEFVLTLLAGPVIYDRDKPDLPLTGDEVEEGITTYDTERLKELYEHSKELMEREEEARTSVEGRANVLLGAGGLTTTLIIGVSGLLARGGLDGVLPVGTPSRAVFLFLYLSGLFALVMSLLRAVQVARVVSYGPFSATRPFRVQEFAPAVRYRKLIREAFLAHVELKLMIRIKAGLLKAAQFWFAVALALLLVMASVPVLAPLCAQIIGSVGHALAWLLAWIVGC